MTIMEDEKVESVYDLNLADLWTSHLKERRKAQHRAYSTEPEWSDVRAFQEMLENLLEYSDEVDQVHFCDTCKSPMFDDDEVADIDGEVHCEGCIDKHFSKCNCCDEYVLDDALLSTTDPEYATCRGCRESYFYHCDYCDEYYHRNWEHWHDDDGNCDCDSVLDQVQTFAIRNGDGLLMNDVQVPFEIPAGTVSEEGMNEIWSLLINWTYNTHYTTSTPAEYEKIYHAVDQAYQHLEPVWQTREGNMPKRVSRALYKEGVKVPQVLLTQIGNIARSQSDGVDFTVAVTRQLNLGPEEFAHSGSCWWGEYGYARCALKNNGGFALRSFTDDENHRYAYGTRVNGRAWVLPLKNVERGPKPTFETETPEAFVVFNGYGKLSGYAGARIIGLMTGWSYRKIDFDSEDLYVNAGGYLVGPEDVIGDFGLHSGGRSIVLDFDIHNSVIDSRRSYALADA